ncbi:NAD-dependent epimerase/dehydratase family protein [Nocardia takedensis]|uniref:NAD-dependent epimerase/dehydratase family protein n=1 Tax=Nocardia takedensis TaxID=259390 RepID=UPI000593D41E|nr:NAD-dependent epimerase/dehydratase family protein [Nocardia takedensis]
MRVLVTGANGYLGGAVCAALRGAGHEVTGLVHRGRDRVPADLPTRSADLRDTASLTTALDGIDAVCHLAGLARARDSHAEPLRYFEVNTGGTLSLLRAMDTARVRALVFASTGAIYGTPERQPIDEDTPDAPPHPYALSKQAAETAVAAQTATGTLSATILRLFTVAGGAPTDDTGLIPRLLAVAAGDLPRLPINGDGSVVRDYLHVEDAAAAFLAAVDHLPAPGTCRRYNIAGGLGASVNELVAATARIAGRPVPVEHRRAVAESRRLVGDSARAAAELGWRATRSDITTILRAAWAAHHR